MFLFRRVKQTERTPGLRKLWIKTLAILSHPERDMQVEEILTMTLIASSAAVNFEMYNFTVIPTTLLI